MLAGLADFGGPLLAAAPLGLLFLVALVAGAIDAIAGGGGLLCLPALLWSGLSPAQSLATNKMQCSAGSFSAAWHFHRAGAISLRAMAPAVIAVLVAAFAGALLAQKIDADLLRRLLPILLMLIAAYFLFMPTPLAQERPARVFLPFFALTAAPLVGFYDGFFGPGAGSFYAIACVEMLGYSLPRATAHSKLLNFASNIASLLAFLLGGQIVWSIALVMAVGQFIGGRVGSQLVLQRGTRLVRPLLVVMSMAMTVRLVYADEAGWAHREILALWHWGGSFF